MMLSVRRTLRVPDPVRLARFERSPDLGPRLLVFSGGTALRRTRRELVRYTHNSIHIVTPLDSGGSSAELRRAFSMPAIGDVRNRLMALADRSLLGNPEVFELFAYRFGRSDPDALRGELAAMIDGEHPLVARILDPMRKIIRSHLDRFHREMPADFDLRGASIGNLILTGGYLGNRRHLDPVIYIFSKLVNVRGTVRPVTNADLHLVAELEDGRVVVGQRRLTGKEAAPISSPVRRVYISESTESPAPVRPEIREKMRLLIQEADLVCYPMGSFYSSLVANFLPSGVGRAIAGLDCPKVFVPSTAPDPELYGKTPSDQVAELLAYLRADCPAGTSDGELLDFVVVDRKNGTYGGPIGEEALRNRGIRVIDAALITDGSRPLIDEKRLVPLLLSLC
jgi:CofD-related protein of GAK system